MSINFGQRDISLVFNRDVLSLNQSDDPRVGSARDNATTAQVTRLPQGTNSASGYQLLMTIVPVLVYATVCVLIFWVLRRKLDRVFSPRTFLGSLDPHERTPALPMGWFNWIKPFAQVPDTFVLNHSSLDSYFFLRYLKILCVICLVGCCITWPILIPLHVLGGRGGEQLDLLTFGNVVNPNWYYVHACLAWVFFGFIMYMISRECIYFIHLRQAYLMSPYYSNRLSSRTVLFTCVPQQNLEKAKLREIFGDKVKNIWIPTDTEDLDELVKERYQTAMRLERAEIKLIRMANAARDKDIKSGIPQTEGTVQEDVGPVSILPDGDRAGGDSESKPEFDIALKSTLPNVNGSVAAQWIPATKRPIHRPIANYGRRVDTIKWTRTRLKELGPMIHKLRRHARSGRARPIPAAFIEFETQVDAQGAFQTLSHHRAFHMTPHIVGVRPSEIHWSALRMTWWERIVRKFSVMAAVAAMVIFWSIPCALIGIITNIQFLTEKVFFLAWLKLLPTAILGFITGLVPALALSWLMSIVPWIMRFCARTSGVPTTSLIELYCQNAYFVFQVVQVFLVTTLTSAASAAFSDILANPMSARDLLSANLPKASNFYISYFLLQGLAMSATALLQLFQVFRHQVFKGSDNPRHVSTKWHNLRIIHWGARFPVFTNMGVIAISYSCIAPIILGFAAVGLYAVYLVYRYNILYVYSSEVDTRGLCYPRALKQTLTGVYLAEVCMIGLFGIAGAAGPLIIMILLIIFTILVHISLDDALGPLLYNLPKTLAVEEQHRMNPGGGIQLPSTDIAAPDVENATIPSSPLPKPDVHEDDSGSESESESYPTQEPNATRSLALRAPEGLSSAFTLTRGTVMNKVSNKLSSTLSPHLNYLDFWTPLISPQPSTRPNFILKFLHPEIYQDHNALHALIPPSLHALGMQYTLDERWAKDAYYPPSVSVQAPVLWIPNDAAGAKVSAQEVEHTSAVVKVTDAGAWIGKNNHVMIDLEAKSPVLLDRVRC